MFYGRNSQKLGSCQCSKELQISKPISLQAALLVIGSHGRELALPRWEKGKSKDGKGRSGESKRETLCSEDLRSWQDGEVKKLYID